MNYLSEEGIQPQLSTSGMPQQNGVAERENKTLLDMIRSMMSYSNMPNSFWGHALETTSSKSVPITPIKLWNRLTPRMFGYGVVQLTY